MKNYNSILTVFHEITKSKSENGIAKHNSKLLFNIMLRRETGYLCLLWKDILEWCYKISINLQYKTNDILQAVK